MGIKDLPLTKGSRHCKVLESFGWEVRRSHKNHFILTHANYPAIHLSIPDHPEVDRYLLHAELRKANISDKEYRARFDKLF